MRPDCLFVKFSAAQFFILLFLSISTSASPFDIKPMPSSVSFPGQTALIPSETINVDFVAVNGDGIVVGYDYLSESRMLALVLWDSSSSTVVGRGLLDLSSELTAESPHLNQPMISIASDRKILLMFQKYSSSDENYKLASFRGAIDSMTKLTSPVAEYYQSEITEASDQGERLVSFARYKPSGTLEYVSYFVSPSSDFTLATTNLRLKDLETESGRFYLADNNRSYVQNIAQNSYRLFDRTGTTQVATFDSEDSLVVVGQDLTAISERKGNITLRSLSSPATFRRIPGKIQLGDGESLPGLGFAVTGSSNGSTQSIFISPEGKVQNINCALPYRSSNPDGGEQLSVSRFTGASGSHFLASGFYSQNNEEVSSSYDFLIRPDFSATVKNYCSVLKVTPTGDCSRLFQKSETGGSMSLKSGEKLTRSCTFSVEFSPEEGRGRLPVTLEIRGQKGRRTRTRTVKIPSGKGTFSIAPKEFSYVYLTASPSARRSNIIPSQYTIYF